MSLKNAARPSRASDVLLHDDEPKKNGGWENPTTASTQRVDDALDDVDFSREIAGHFETNFLLANGWL